MEACWNDLIRKRLYKDLLISTDESLALDLNNISALTYKSRALMYLRNYQNAYSTLITVLKYNLPGHHRVKLKKFLQHCSELLKFQENFEKTVQKRKITLKTGTKTICLM